MNLYTQQANIFQAQFQAMKDTDLQEAGQAFEKCNRAHDVSKEHGDISKIVPVFYGARDQADFPDLESHEAYLDYGKAFPDEFHYKEGSIYALRWAWGRAVAAADMAFPDPASFNKDKDFIVFVTTGGAAGADDFVLQARRNGEELPSGSTVVGVYDPEDGLLSLFITSLLMGDGTADAPAGKQSYVRAWNDMKEYVRKGMLPPSPKKKKIVVRRFRKVPDDMRLRLALEEAVNRADGTVLDQAKEKSEECPFCHSSSGFSLQEDHGNDWPRCNNCGAC